MGDELVKQTLDAIKHNATNNKKKNRIVLTHAMYRQTIREYVINKLLQQGGIPKTNITVIQLQTDPDAEREALYYRNKKLAKSGQPTFEDHKRGLNKEKVFVVDVSKRDITHLNQLDEAI